ncbi:MAG: DUF362 domain-containing protein [Clostridia bacterium]|nr:DUF362 domain-containing protein [Clostridia bacterium]
MGKLKNVIIFGVIILLGIAAVAGYFIKNSTGKSTNAETAKEVTIDATKAATTSTGTKVSDEPKAPVMLNVSESIVAKGESEREKHVKELLNKAMENPDPNPVVGIGRGEDHAKVTDMAIENAGGLKGIVKKGDVVLIKPNICYNSTPDSSIITDYRVVQQIADKAKEMGASRVIVAEGSFSGNAFDVLENKYSTLKGVEFLNFNDFDTKDCYELQPLKSLVGKGLFIPKAYMDADVVINVAKMKTHFLPEAVVSLSIKNCIGIPPERIYTGAGSKDGLHMLGIMETIIDLNRIRKPDLSIIEGIIGGEGEGPMYNTPVNSNIILAGKDLAALDTVGLTFMGFKLDEVPHVKRAGEEKLGITDIKKIKVVGADLNSIKMDFQSSFKLLRE